MRTRKQAYRQRRLIRKRERMLRRAGRGVMFPVSHPMSSHLPEHAVYGSAT